MGSDLVDIYNFKERFEEALAGNKKKVDTISKASDNARKRPDKNFEKCKGLNCFASAFDSNLQ